MLITCLGLSRLKSNINTLDFLPKDSPVLADFVHIENNLTSMSSIEAVVDLNDPAMPFIEKLDEIRRVESILQEHPAVRHSLSLATFFPSLGA